MAAVKLEQNNPFQRSKLLFVKTTKWSVFRTQNPSHYWNLCFDSDVTLWNLCYCRSICLCHHIEQYPLFTFTLPAHVSIFPSIAFNYNLVSFSEQKQLCRTTSACSIVFLYAVLMILSSMSFSYMHSFILSKVKLFIKCEYGFSRLSLLNSTEGYFLS